MERGKAGPSTLANVAASAGVSIATVSKRLNGRDYVGPPPVHGAWTYGSIRADGGDFVTGGNLGYMNFPPVEGGEGDLSDTVGNPGPYYRSRRKPPMRRRRQPRSSSPPRCWTTPRWLTPRFSRSEPINQVRSASSPSGVPLVENGRVVRA